MHVQLASSRSSQRHTVAAALAPDGSRTFKLNGKSKTGKELRVRWHLAAALACCGGWPAGRRRPARHTANTLPNYLSPGAAPCWLFVCAQEFLKSAGISLDSSGAVIKQAQVHAACDTKARRPASQLPCRPRMALTEQDVSPHCSSFPAEVSLLAIAAGNAAGGHQQPRRPGRGCGRCQRARWAVLCARP